MKLFGIVALSVMLAPAVHAQAADQSLGREGELRAKLLIVDDVDAFWKAWAGPTPPYISTTSEIRRGRPIFAMLIFAGCRAGADGNCNLTVTYNVTEPDGSLHDEPVVAKAWTGPPAPGENIQAAEGSLGLELDDQDPSGPYRIEAILNDEVAGTSVTASEFAIAEPPLPRS